MSNQLKDIKSKIGFKKDTVVTLVCDIDGVLNVCSHDKKSIYDLTYDMLTQLFVDMNRMNIKDMQKYLLPTFNESNFNPEKPILEIPNNKLKKLDLDFIDNYISDEEDDLVITSEELWDQFGFENPIYEEKELNQFIEENLDEINEFIDEYLNFDNNTQSMKGQ